MVDPENLIPYALQCVLEGGRRSEAVAALSRDIGREATLCGRGGFLHPRTGRLTQAGVRLIQLLNSRVPEIAVLASRDRSTRRLAVKYRRQLQRRIERGGTRPVPWWRQAWSLIVGAGQEIRAASSPPVTREVREARLALCRGCPSLLRAESPALDRCGQCKCFVALKSSWKTQKCPLGKW